MNKTQKELDYDKFQYEFSKASIGGGLGGLGKQRIVIGLNEYFVTSELDLAQQISDKNKMRIEKSKAEQEYFNKLDNKQ